MEGFMKAAKAQNWAVESQGKKDYNRSPVKTTLWSKNLPESLIIIQSVKKLPALVRNEGEQDENAKSLSSLLINVARFSSGKYPKRKQKRSLFKSCGI
jgi:hypothetical protein